MPSINPVPRSVVLFMRAHVDHVVKLQFLLMLHAAPNGTATVRAMALALGVPKAQVRDMANELVDDGLLRVSADELELAPASIDDRLAVADLAETYARDRSAVLELLAAMVGGRRSS
jgi:DNA-binding IclR family transcriptional regulator